MNQPTEDRIKKIEERQEDFDKRLSDVEKQRTEEIKTVKVEVASEDVAKRLDNLTQELYTISNTWLNTLQEHYTEHKKDIAEVQTVQRGHSKYFEEHGKRLAATATKEDISELKATMASKDDANNRFDKVEGDIAELKGLIMQLIQQKR